MFFIVVVVLIIHQMQIFSPLVQLILHCGKQMVYLFYLSPELLASLRHSRPSRKKKNRNYQILPKLFINLYRSCDLRILLARPRPEP